jgi:hypothetical protein
MAIGIDHPTVVAVMAKHEALDRRSLKSAPTKEAAHGNDDSHQPD